jgi:hypothetical protein
MEYLMPLNDPWMNVEHPSKEHHCRSLHPFVYEVSTMDKLEIAGLEIMNDLYVSCSTWLLTQNPMRHWLAFYL